MDLRLAHCFPQPFPLVDAQFGGPPDGRQSPPKCRSRDPDDRPVSANPTFEPGRLRLARELRQLSQADLARRLEVTPAAISQYESGATRPGRESLKRLSVVLEVPPAFFSLQLVETHEGFFRSLRRTSLGQRRRARAIANIAHDIASTKTATNVLSTVAIPHIPVTSLQAGREELEDIAEQVRQDWRLPRGPVTNVVELLENHGVVVTRLPLDTPDVDAFSLPFPDRPVIVLGADKSDRARSRFDAAHELGHLVAHGDQVWGVKEVEDQAHQFAAAFLMPKQDIFEALPTRADWPVLFDLKQQWQVSLAALLMRARRLGRMSEHNYLAAVKTASARGWRRTEPVPLGHPEEPARFHALLTSDTNASTNAALPRHLIDALAGATSA
jgi:Zn-dependent peptidase ImmA (M78 family)/DNA-binding transcriptional regulator YiaG